MYGLVGAACVESSSSSSAVSSPSNRRPCKFSEWSGVEGRGVVGRGVEGRWRMASASRNLYTPPGRGGSVNSSCVVSAWGMDGGWLAGSAVHRMVCHWMASLD